MKKILIMLSFALLISGVVTFSYCIGNYVKEAITVKEVDGKVTEKEKKRVEDNFKSLIMALLISDGLGS